MIKVRSTYSVNLPQTGPVNSFLRVTRPYVSIMLHNDSESDTLPTHKIAFIVCLLYKL